MEIKKKKKKGHVSFHLGVVCLDWFIYLLINTVINFDVKMGCKLRTIIFFYTQLHVNVFGHVRPKLVCIFGVGGFQAWAADPTCLTYGHTQGPEHIRSLSCTSVVHVAIIIPFHRPAPFTGWAYPNIWVWGAIRLESTSKIYIKFLGPPLKPMWKFWTCHPNSHENCGFAHKTQLSVWISAGFSQC